MEELFKEWEQRLKQSPWGEPLATQQERIRKEVRILEALEAAGCTQIPNEPFDVPCMIQDRYRLLEGMRGSLS